MHREWGSHCSRCLQPLGTPVKPSQYPGHSPTADGPNSACIKSNVYRAEMNKPEASKLLDLLAALSHQTSFSVGCYCENEKRCHRSILKKLLTERGAEFVT